MTKRIVVMAGGTGGHVFPALAVADDLRSRGMEVRWLGTRAGMEADIVPRHGFPMEFVAVSGLRGKGVLGWLLAPVRLVRSLWQALSILRRVRPDAVLGLGGFVTGPGGVAARMLGIPLLVHEQNAIPGLTNRMLSKIADVVMEAFPRTFRHAIHTGNPVREVITGIAEPEQRFAGRTGPLRLFIVGGSLGAVSLNQTVPDAVARLEPEYRPQVRHQSGKRNFDTTQDRYRSAGVTAEVMAFVDDMAAAYAWADLVICRSGALTVSELAAAGVASVLVPYPHAVDDHQTRNAEFLVHAGAAILVPQQHLTAEHLAKILRDFCADPVSGRNKLLHMAKAARALARPDATRRVADLCAASTNKVN